MCNREGSYYPGTDQGDRNRSKLGRSDKTASREGQRRRKEKTRRCVLMSTPAQSIR